MADTDATAAGEAISRLSASVQQDLAAAAGDLSLCAIAKSGRPMPALKYHEGRAAMLAEIQRCLVEGRTVAACLHDGKQRWDRLRDLATKSEDWAAYLQGATDMATDLAAELGDERGVDSAAGEAR